MFFSRLEFAQSGEIKYTEKGILSCILAINGRKECSQQQVSWVIRYSPVTQGGSNSRSSISSYVPNLILA